MRTTCLSFLLIIIAALVYTGCESVNSPNSKSDVNLITTDVSEAEAHAGNTVYVDATNGGAEDGSQTNPFNTIQEGVDHANSGDVVLLQSDFTLTASEGQVTITNPMTLDGNGKTIYASFAKTSNSNNSAIGIKGTSNVTVKDLTIDGSGGTDLHGIIAYVSTGIEINNVTISDNRTGVVVNGSEVTVENITTSGHTWHAMNVDLGGGVTDPAILTVKGTSSHAENYPPIPHIWVDDTTKDVEVIDVEGQYDYEESGNARAYFLIPVPETKDDCKKGGWEDYGFKNQGQCIRYVNTGKDSR